MKQCPQCGVPIANKRQVFCSHACANYAKVGHGKDYDPKLRRDWRNHKMDASRRGVRFLLTYGEWLEIWRGSGRVDQRGCGRGQYVMARFGDKGPYKIGNVRIIRAEDNHAERKIRRDQHGKYRQYKRKASWGRSLSI